MVINATKLLLSRDNLCYNVNYLEKVKGKKVLAVVKANGYGHGMDEVVKILYENGQREFAVARYVEAMRILKMGYKDVNILVFESIGDYFMALDKKNIDISVNTLEELKLALEQGIPANRIQIKIDFGFGRNGIYENEVSEIKKIINERKIKFRGIYSHLFAVTYDDGLKYIEKFNKIIKLLGKENFEMIHLQNSAATLSYDCEVVTHIRVGMAIYGLQDDGFFERNLKQVFSLQSEIASVRDLEESDYIAYRLKDIKESCKYIAKIKIGYADGFLKSNEGSYCLIDNREFKILQVTMDNTFILGDSSIKQGDKVEFYHNPYTSSAHTKMTIYELLTIISQRIPREIR